jgi:hypothetical protein
MSPASRVMLTSTVLNALPLHYMQAFLLPSCVIENLTKINQHFLWKGTADKFSGGHCIIPWKRVNLPKRFDWLGITDIKIQSRAFLIKWLCMTDNEHKLPHNQHQHPHSHISSSRTTNLEPIMNATSTRDNQGKHIGCGGAGSKLMVWTFVASASGLPK